MTKKLPTATGVRQSAIMMQITALVTERGLDAKTLAANIGRPAKHVQSWLDGQAYPDVAALEAMLRAVNLVPVLVASQDYTQGGHLRDMLDARERQVYDTLPTTPRDVLSAQMQDLQLQRLRLENVYQLGLIKDSKYFEAVLDLVQHMRMLADSITRMTLAAGAAGRGGYDDVEHTYGSPRGTAYDEKRVARIKDHDPTEKRKAAKAAEKAKAKKKKKNTRSKLAPSVKK